MQAWWWRGGGSAWCLWCFPESMGFVLQLKQCCSTFITFKYMYMLCCLRLRRCTNKWVSTQVCLYKFASSAFAACVTHKKQRPIRNNHDASCCHMPSTVSFHNVALLLASDTHKILPVSDHDARHTGVLKSCSSSFVHPCCCWPSPSVHINTLPSCPALAIVLDGNPRDGAHATSRTQSLCPTNAGPS